MERTLLGVIPGVETMTDTWYFSFTEFDHYDTGWNVLLKELRPTCKKIEFKTKY